MNATRLFALLCLLTLAIGVTLPFVMPWGKPLAILASLTLVTLITELVLYRIIVRPHRVAEIGMDLLREQDYSTRLAPVGQRDADKIVALFNDLISRLKAEKLHAGEQNHLLNLLIDASPLGILSLDREGRIQIANASSARILGGEVKGKTLAEIASPIAAKCATLAKGETAILRLSDNMVYRCSRLSFMDRGVSHPFFLVEILTEEVLMAEREAYGKAIRMIGHEVNNSMASVGSILSLLLDIRPWGEEDTDISEAVMACSARVAGLSEFISSYSKVVKIPPVRKEGKNLAEFITRLRPLLGAMASDHAISLDLSIIDPSSASIGIDVPLLEQAVINIVKNSVESIGDRPGGHIEISVTGSHRLTVTDNGPGI
ncbi:MAG: PAS domain-containing sensor histidine kinase, partial [Duncaniella sp.]|nr:PAS domain-containing sensor histidine kinase [Duncaniella sp.]